MQDMNNKIGKYCKQFREEKLLINLTDFSNLHNDNIKNVNAFEYGRANNIKYLYYYYHQAEINNDEDEFLDGLFRIL